MEYCLWSSDYFSLCVVNIKMYNKLIGVKVITMKSLKSAIILKFNGQPSSCAYKPEATADYLTADHHLARCSRCCPSLSWSLWQSPGPLLGITTAPNLSPSAATLAVIWSVPPKRKFRKAPKSASRSTSAVLIDPTNLLNYLMR